MKQKFTKGPWLINDNHIFSVGKTICTLPPQIVDIPCQHKEFLEQEANAKLIACAPDLYEACLKVIENYKNHAQAGHKFSMSDVVAIKQVEQALKKVEGL